MAAIQGFRREEMKSLKMYQTERLYTDPAYSARTCREIRKASPTLEPGHVASGIAALILQRVLKGGFVRIRPLSVSCIDYAYMRTPG